MLSYIQNIIIEQECKSFAEELQL